VLSKNNVNKLIETLCSMINCEPLQLNEENVCAFRYVKESKELDVTLHYAEENKLITLLSIITPLSLDSTRDLVMIKSLLIFCFPGFISKGSCISINSYENTVVLTYQTSDETSIDLFYNIFINFIDTALAFIEHIKKIERSITQNSQIRPIQTYSFINKTLSNF
jgi:hypothetical protein